MNTSANPIASAAVGLDEQYRCPPMVRWRQGRGRDLLHFPLVGANRSMSSLMASALQLWTSFLSVEDAEGQISEALPSISRDEVTATIKELIASGCLISRSSLTAGGGSIPWPAPVGAISWLAIPTANRNESFQRMLSSFLENVRHFDHKCQVLIGDDARDVSCVEGASEASKLVGEDPPISIWYAGIQERHVFADCLAEKGDIPPEVIRYGLFGSQSSLRTLGANRNVMLLQTLGTLSLHADDDTICDARVVPGTSCGLAVGGHNSPAEAWYFRSSLAALGFGTAVPIDVLGEHAKYLGRPLGDLLSGSAGGHSGDVDNMCGHVLTSLHARLGHVRITYNGARGDCGFHSDFPFVSDGCDKNGGRLLELGEKYRETLNSRQIVRQATCPTISHADAASVGMFMGLDNRVSLPAFVPDCRNSDGVFAQFLSRCSEHNYVAHLPFTLAHTPLEGRAYAADRDVVVRASDLIIGCLSTWRPEPGSNDPLDRLCAIGRHFRRLGSLRAAEFDEIANVLMCARASSMIESLDGALADYDRTAQYWSEDVSGRIAALRLAVENPDFFVPVDLPNDSSDPPRRRAQRMVARYGELLEWWPVITERTIELRKKGITVARCLSGSRAAL